MTLSVQDQLRLEKKSMLLLPIFITVLKRGTQRFNFICTISYIKKHYSLLCQFQGLWTCNTKSCHGLMRDPQVNTAPFQVTSLTQQPLVRLMWINVTAKTWITYVVAFFAHMDLID